MIFPSFLLPHFFYLKLLSEKKVARVIYFTDWIFPKINI